jgi:hypothetical protein
MKKIRIHLFLAVFAVLVSSNTSASNLYLSMYDNSSFTAVFNNQLYDRPASEITISNVPGGSHYLKVARKSPDGTQSYSQIMFDGYIKLPDSYDIFAVIDENYNFVVYKKTPSSVTTDTKCNCDCEACRNCIYKHIHTEEIVFDCSTQIMTPGAFSDLKTTVNNTSFESSKVDVIKSVADLNYFTAAQVRELLLLFSFDQSKVEIAKYVYQKTCDRRNYFKIYDAFSFESSKSEVINYISQIK